MMKIKTGDTIEVILGKDRAKTGKVIQIFSKEGKIVVEGLNKIKKHMRPAQKSEKGQIIELAGPINISNVMLVCPKCEKKTRVGIKMEGKKKSRMCKKCKEIID